MKRILVIIVFILLCGAGKPEVMIVNLIDNTTPVNNKYDEDLIRDIYLDNLQLVARSDRSSIASNLLDTITLPILRECDIGLYTLFPSNNYTLYVFFNDAESKDDLFVNGMVVLSHAPLERIELDALKGIESASMHLYDPTFSITNEYFLQDGTLVLLRYSNSKFAGAEDWKYVYPCNEYYRNILELDLPW